MFVERLIVERPHPWGVMYTFFELIRTPKYQLKEKNFIKTKDMEHIFKYLFKSMYPGNDRSN